MSDSEKSDDETRRLPIGDARIEQRDGEAWLVVSGEAPCANMEVTLEPAVYVVQPDWWQVTLESESATLSRGEYLAGLVLDAARHGRDRLIT